MKEKKALYPDRSVYTQQIGPGLCFGALALMLRFFFEVPGGRGGGHFTGPPFQAGAGASHTPGTTGIVQSWPLRCRGRGAGAGRRASASMPKAQQGLMAQTLSALGFGGREDQHGLDSEGRAVSQSPGVT